MSLFNIIYEFPITEKTINDLIEDLEIEGQKGLLIPVAENIRNTINDNTYCKLRVHDKPGLMLKLSKNIEAERLPYSVEGLMAFVHGSSEGFLTLEEFKGLLESFFDRIGIQYKKYD